MFHVAGKPSRDFGRGNQKAQTQQKRLLDHLALFDYFQCWESACSSEDLISFPPAPAVCGGYL